jgi:hypothetical protein
MPGVSSIRSASGWCSIWWAARGVGVWHSAISPYHTGGHVLLASPRRKKRDGGAEQQMIDAQSGVAVKGVPEILAEV